MIGITMRGLTISPRSLRGRPSSGGIVPLPSFTKLIAPAPRSASAIGRFKSICITSLRVVQYIVPMIDRLVIRISVRAIIPGATNVATPRSMPMVARPNP